MKPNQLRSIQSKCDVTGIGRRIARRDRRAARRFLLAVEATYEMIADMPEGGAIWEPERIAVEGVRYWIVKGFRNHIVFYRVIPGGTEILRVLHGGMDAEQEMEEWDAGAP